MTTIDKIKEYVYKYANEYGYKCPDGILAQALTESGLNGSGLSNNYNNFWGMKAGSDWNGKTITLKTKEEYVKGVLTPIYAKFRVFDSIEDGVIGFFEFCKYTRYKDIKNATTVEEYATKMKNAGWATSSVYRNSIIKNYNKYILGNNNNVKDNTNVINAVKSLQKALNEYGNYGLAVDGIIGPKTTAAYQKFRGTI